MNVSSPLDGKRIVLTRAVEQARELKARLEKMGAVILLFPAVTGVRAAWVYERNPASCQPW